MKFTAGDGIDAYRKKTSINTYNTVHMDGINGLWSGLLIYKSNSAGEDSMTALLNDWICGKHSFSELLGTYRVIIEDDKQDKTVFFCDNAGMRCFYYSEEQGLYSDSFLTLARKFFLQSPIIPQ